MDSIFLKSRCCFHLNLEYDDLDEVSNMPKFRGKVKLLSTWNQDAGESGGVSDAKNVFVGSEVNVFH
jgi:hypothetical protein